jgi:hypothetical protein
VQDRSRKLLKGLGIDASHRLSLATAWPRLDEGGDEYVAEWATKVERPALVVVDVWAKFRPVYRTQGNQYDQDYQHGSVMKEIADRHGFSLLALHHTKKDRADDIVDDVSGTLGIAGSADGLLILTRHRGENDGRVFVTGRDVDERELAVNFDPETATWKYVGDADQVGRSRVRQVLVEMLKRGGALTAPHCAEVAEMDIGTVRKELWRMVQDGTAEKLGNRYRLKAELAF